MAPAPQRAADWDEGWQIIEVSTGEGLRALCGYWQDQKESVYLLLPGAARTLRVYTLRPSGRLRYTQHLVRLITQNGLPRVVWGTNRYTLMRRGSGSIRWQGHGEGDKYDWIRLA